MANPNPTVTIRGKNKSAAAFRDARSSMESMKKHAKSVAVALGAVSAATLLVIRNTTESTRATRAYAAALGVSVENLSRWEFAAERVGLSGDKVGDIMKDAADKIGDAFRNNAGEAKEALESLGLDLDKVARMNADDQLLAIAGALEGVGTTAEKVQILESIGNDLSLMLPLLDDNAAGLQEMADKADALGVTLTSFEAEQIGIADQALQDMQGTFESLGQDLTVQFAPILRQIADMLSFGLPWAIEQTNEALDYFGAVVAAAWEWLNPSDITGPTTFEEALERNLRAAKELREEIEAMHGRSLTLSIYGADAEQAGRDALEKQNELRRAELDAQYQFEDERTRRAQSGDRARLAFSTWASGKQAETIIGDVIATTRGVAHQNKALFEINKIAGIGEAIINTHKGVTRSLAEYPWPLAGVMAGIHLAAGLAQVAAIKSATFGGGGGGGSAGGGGNGPVPTPPSDFATAPITNEPRGPTVQITVQGNVLANDDWRAAMVKQIETAIDNDELRIR